MCGGSPRAPAPPPAVPEAPRAPDTGSSQAGQDSSSERAGLISACEKGQERRQETAGGSINVARSVRAKRDNAGQTEAYMADGTISACEKGHECQQAMKAKPPAAP